MTTQTATAPSTAILPAVQLTVAARLARTYGHEWAEFVEDDESISPAVIAARVAAYWREVVDERGRTRAEVFGGPGGIAWPVIDEPGYVAHVTGSGRLRWRVGADGCVDLTITRPGDEIVATAFVAADEQIVCGNATRASGRLYVRHVSALRDAVYAALGLTEARIGGPDAPPIEEGRADIEAAFAPLYAAALPDGELVKRQCPECRYTSYLLETAADQRCASCARPFDVPDDRPAAKW